MNIEWKIFLDFLKECGINVIEDYKPYSITDNYKMLDNIKNAFMSLNYNQLEVIKDAFLNKNLQ